ncbi:GATOR complex protein NPRL3-like [Oppia nitens]|uniref:GATOR complex protein NPRL3-like n=1 Tax=Oppia nitens TaxID=1686743 RepID=UPI0023D98CEB|nr:GATOR complex protein NPRL3-like [Oppia nitens]
MSSDADMSSVKDDESSPLGVFLVKSDSKEDKLLFRYPYTIDGQLNELINKQNKYAIIINEDTFNTDRLDNSLYKPMGKESQTISYSDLTSSISSQINNTSTDETIAKVIGITDISFSNLFAVNSKLCGQKFELKVNDIRFVGHPMLLTRGQKELLIFNVVFALKANASHDIVNCYHELSQKIAIGLHYEENRCGYLSCETKLMVALHDEVTAMTEDTMHEESPYKLILLKSRLAKDLKTVYENLLTTGLVRVRLNRWIEISFCLPQKVHRLLLKHHSKMPPITPQNIIDCLQALRPYHAILLLVESQELLDSLPQDVSPAFTRIVKFANPIKNLLELSADADITLSQVFHIVAQLVYWAKATVVYPLCENNVYTIHPLAPTNVDSPLVDEFDEKFPGSDGLLKYLSKFSLSMSLSQLRNPMDSQYQQVLQVQIVVWLLKHRMLQQLHTYVYLVPLSQSTPYLTQRVSQSHSDRPNSALTGDMDGIDYSTGSSFPSEDSLATSPAIGTNFQHSSASEEDLSSPKFSSSMIEESGTALLRVIGLSQSEIESILRVSASKNIEDLKLFIKLCPYFNGRHHLEDIMYYENVKRGQLLTLIDKFRDVLFTSQYEDSAVSQLCPYNYSA